MGTGVLNLDLDCLFVICSHFLKIFNKFQKAKLSNGLFPRLDLVSYSNKLFSPSSHTQFESYVRDLNDLNHLMLRTHLEAINGDKI